VASAALDGGTQARQDVTLRRPGIDTTFVTAGRSEAFAAAMRAAAKAFSHTGAVRGYVSGVAARNLSQVV
jgi:O-acetylhomoserine/O-acetylserine sulfhydrylase-like pyridoxal-dependent enzyme